MNQTEKKPAYPAGYIACGRFRLSLAKPLIMGILNVTPDSFSDGGQFFDPAAALAHAQQLIDEGADVIDVGGESTRPNAPQVSVAQELARVIPVLEGLRNCPVPVSIDTRKPEVMQAALQLGISLVNDISALEAEGALALLAQHDAAVCLMHKQGEPQTMQAQPEYADVVAEVLDYLAQRRQAALQAGIAAERIILDPGFGFGKRYEHNVTLFRHLSAMQALHSPVLVGVSRKSMLGQILHGRPAAERDGASVAAALLAVQAGAAIVRVHAVGATRDALAVWEALRAGAD